ncbi:MAG TPA: TetR/AcrR family transcriptional regulator [Candidatus Acidoferrales bacterium]|nr:TetR/AcrR family transcriptional regulator [Candidatus Acidoferrales bacterium]
MRGTNALASPNPAARQAAPARAGRRERRRNETRERIFRAALELFAERGYLETTVEDITEAADVGKGTFFNYFQTKEHVLATFGAERLAALERALERAKAGPVLPVLRELAIDLAGQSTESPALLRAIYAAHASCAPVRAELHKRLQTGRRLLAEIFARAQARGEVRRDRSPADLGRLMQVVLFGITLAWALNPDSALRGTAHDVWDLFLPSLRADERRKSVKNRRSART